MIFILKYIGNKTIGGTSSKCANSIVFFRASRKIHWKWFLLYKLIANKFYHKNTLEIIKKKGEYPINVLISQFLSGLVEKYIGNGFYFKNSLQINFIIKMRWKLLKKQGEYPVNALILFFFYCLGL